MLWISISLRCFTSSIQLLQPYWSYLRQNTTQFNHVNRIVYHDRKSRIESTNLVKTQNWMVRNIRLAQRSDPDRLNKIKKGIKHAHNSLCYHNYSLNIFTQPIILLPHGQRMINLIFTSKNIDDGIWDL